MDKYRPDTLNLLYYALFLFEFEFEVQCQPYQSPVLQRLFQKYLATVTAEGPTAGRENGVDCVPTNAFARNFTETDRH